MNFETYNKSNQVNNGGVMVHRNLCQEIMYKPNMTVTVGTIVTLNCNNKEQVWRRSNSIIAFKEKSSNIWNVNKKYKIVNSSNNRHGLQIFNISNEDEDTYCCYGVRSIECTRLHVEDDPYAHSSDLDKEVCENAYVSLSCSLLPYPKSTSVYWKKDGEIVNLKNDRLTGSTLSNPSLTIKNTTVDDTGIYQCHVVSSIGDLQGDAIRLRVKNLLSIKPNKNVIDTTENSNISLECNYESCLMVPISEVIWTKRPIKRKDGEFGRITIQRPVFRPSLLIHRVNVYDSGIYTCQVNANSNTATGEDILLLVKELIPEKPKENHEFIPEKPKENHVIIIGAAFGSVMTLLIGIFGVTMLALRLHLRREISLNNRHHSTESNHPGVDESNQNRETAHDENDESNQSTNTMNNAYDEIDESQMVEATQTTQTDIDARTSILTNIPRRYENTVLTSSKAVLFRRYENTVLTLSKSASDDQVLRKCAGKGQQNMLEQNIVQEQCEQKRVTQTFDNNCFGLNHLQVFDYEEPFKVLKNDCRGSSCDIQDITK